MAKVILYPHQRTAVNELRNGNILYGDVGSGKTITSVTYYMEKEAPRDVYVITTAKKRDSLDWERDFASYGVGRTSDSTVAGILTVDSWNNIGKYKDVKGAFFIFDEQRLVGSGAWTKAFILIARSNHWILLTATPGDTWLDYIPVFVANGFYRNRTAFLREHVVYNRFTKFPSVERYLGEATLQRHKREILVEMHFVRHTRRTTKILHVPYDVDLFERVAKKRWHVYEQRPLKGVAELFLVMRKVVNSDARRLDSVRTLLRTHPKVIVFYNFDYELEALRSLATSDVKSNGSLSSLSSDGSLTTNSLKLKKKPSNSKSASTKISLESSPIKALRLLDAEDVDDFGQNTKLQVAEWNGHKHQPIPTSDRWLYLVQYQAGAEGWNCIDTDAMVFYSLTYSYKLFHQAHGRIDRLNTPFEELKYYILMSDSMIDRAIWACLKRKKSFNESKFWQKSTTALRVAA